ncbi:MAG: response regulator [Gemmatimonadetes bacterium]|nr:response regulator [Gemmatimonadota bacterium]NIQ56294.1 response regulator [Gemmatimonadota bacterium]NIU76480.1 response regulator [Gammaproteobacteria bacterium]NIX45965.1 response regulator [Gemmatimonadota bacterium]NIY10281.1 response regulator [Gemmatimonadota bacterium]
MSTVPASALILVAEDEPLASMAIRAQLDALELRVLGPARNGDEAVALGACFPVDVALLDVRMPRRSGIEAAHALFELAPTPIVLLTGVGHYDLPDPMPRPPIFDVLAKPAGLTDLQDALAAALDRFRRWADDAGVTRAVERSRNDRQTIARAVRARAGEDRLVEVASELLDRAHQTGRSLLDIAHDSLPAP